MSFVPFGWIGCYRLGVTQGLELKKGDSYGHCTSEFDRAYDLGFSGETVYTGTECFNEGENAGLAKLSAGAREHDAARVGVDCVNAYLDGKRDAAAFLVRQPSGDVRLQACYAAGHLDGELFPGLTNSR